MQYNVCGEGVFNVEFMKHLMELGPVIIKLTVSVLGNLTKRPRIINKMIFKDWFNLCESQFPGRMLNNSGWCSTVSNNRASVVLDDLNSPSPTGQQWSALQMTGFT